MDYTKPEGWLVRSLVVVVVVVAVAVGGLYLIALSLPGKAGWVTLCVLCL